MIDTFGVCGNFGVFLRNCRSLRVKSRQQLRVKTRVYLISEESIALNELHRVAFDVSQVLLCNHSWKDSAMSFYLLLFFLLEFFESFILSIERLTFSCSSLSSASYMFLIFLFSSRSYSLSYCWRLLMILSSSSWSTSILLISRVLPQRTFRRGSAS